MSKYTDWPPDVWEKIEIERRQNIARDGGYNEQWHGQREDGSIIMTVAGVPDPDAPDDGFGRSARKWAQALASLVELQGAMREEIPHRKTMHIAVEAAMSSAPPLHPDHVLLHDQEKDDQRPEQGA